MYYLSLDEGGYMTAYAAYDGAGALPEDSPLKGVPCLDGLGGIDTAHMRAYRWDGAKLVLDETRLAELLAAERGEATAIRIAELKAKLAGTDYTVIKIAEGAATAEEYADVIEQRRMWRAEINELEVKINGG